MCNFCCTIVGIGSLSPFATSAAVQRPFSAAVQKALRPLFPPVPPFFALQWLSIVRTGNGWPLIVCVTGISLTTIFVFFQLQLHLHLLAVDSSTRSPSFFFSVLYSGLISLADPLAVPTKAPHVWMRSRSHCPRPSSFPSPRQRSMAWGLLEGEVFAPDQPPNVWCFQANSGVS